VAGFLGDLAVGHQVTRSEAMEDRQHIVVERHGVILPQVGRGRA